MLGPGDPIPSLVVRTPSNPAYALDSVAGRYIALTFVLGTCVPGVLNYLDQVYKSGALFDDRKACCFIIINDPHDEGSKALADRPPGVRVIMDIDRTVARAFGCIKDVARGQETFHLVTYVLDRANRVRTVLPVENLATHFEQLRAIIATLPDPDEEEALNAPVLLVPNLLEAELCRAFIAYAEQKGLEESGFMKSNPATGKTSVAFDHRHKRRSDCLIEDETLRNALQARIVRRLVPQIERAFQYRVTRMERHLIAAYDAKDGGWFKPHRDNTTLGTAHRRFAVSINLNAEDYEGGDLRFPEFGSRVYRPPTGGAVIFSCSLLHEATPITIGRRYCVLPFLYDEAAAQTRLENAQHLSDRSLAEDVVRSVLAPPGWFPTPERLAS